MAIAEEEIVTGKLFSFPGSMRGHAQGNQLVYRPCVLQAFDFVLYLSD